MIVRTTRVKVGHRQAPLESPRLSRVWGFCFVGLSRTRPSQRVRLIPGLDIGEIMVGLLQGPAIVSRYGGHKGVAGCMHHPVSYPLL